MSEVIDFAAERRRRSGAPPPPRYATGDRVRWPCRQRNACGNVETIYKTGIVLQPATRPGFLLIGLPGGRTIIHEDELSAVEIVAVTPCDVEG